MGAFGDALEPLLRTPGGFVFGSNDFQGPRFRNPISYVWKTSAKEAGEAAVMRPDEVREALASGGWLDLNNARGTVDVRGQTIELRGTGDAHESRDKYAQVAGPPAAGTVPLGVTHSPYSRVLDAMARDGVRVVFAGHTHGGQVCVPGYGALTSNCDLPPAQAKGLFRHATADGHSCWVHVGGRRDVAVRALPFRLPARGLATHSHAASRIGAAPPIGLDSFRLLGNRGIGVWRSLVARFVRDEEGAGSNPVTPTCGKPLWLGRMTYVGAALLVSCPYRALT